MPLKNHCGGRSLASGKLIRGVFVADACCSLRCEARRRDGSRYCERCLKKRRARNRDSKPRLRKTFVYAVRVEDAVKFGVATNVDARICNLQVANHRELVVEAILPAPIRIERLCHEYLVDTWIRGEWHRMSPKVKLLISIMKTGNLLHLEQVLTGGDSDRVRGGRSLVASASRYFQGLE